MYCCLSRICYFTFAFGYSSKVLLLSLLERLFFLMEYSFCTFQLNIPHSYRTPNFPLKKTFRMAPEAALHGGYFEAGLSGNHPTECWRESPSNPHKEKEKEGEASDPESPNAHTPIKSTTLLNSKGWDPTNFTCYSDMPQVIICSCLFPHLMSERCLPKIFEGKRRRSGIYISLIVLNPCVSFCPSNSTKENFLEINDFRFLS